MSKTGLLLWCFILLSVFSNCNRNNGVSPDNNTNLSGLQIICPATIKTGNELPVVFYLLTGENTKDISISGNFSLLTENVSMSFDQVALYRGAGSLSTMPLADQPFCLGLSGYSANKEIEIEEKSNFQTVSGSLNSHLTTWEANQKYVVSEDLTVPEGAELVIKNGTCVYVDHKVNIFIHGKLTVEGTSDNPILFDANETGQPWGGIILNNAEGSFKHGFFVHGGADEQKEFGHSNSQAVIFSENSTVNLDSCYLIDNAGKGFGSLNSLMTISNCLISRCDTGGEFARSVLTVSNSYVLEIPNSDDEPVDDDNDGFYVVGSHPDYSETSLIEHCVFIKGKDDAIDHNNVNLEIKDCWLEAFLHEGLAASGGKTVRIYNSVVKNCDQGIEAGYRDPSVYVDHCVVIDNEVGIRFGDSYDWGCYGNMTVKNSILYNNKDNIWNYDFKLKSPLEGAISISYSLTNDIEYDEQVGCIAGIPLFDDNYFLLNNSPGKMGAEDQLDMGKIRK